MLTCFSVSRIPIKFLSLLIIAHIAGLASANEGKAFTNGECIECHDKGPNTQLPYEDILKHSIHQGFSCVDCHAGIKELPHEEKLTGVNCGSCHSDETATYKWHGRLSIPGGEDVPTCADCHGGHNILPSSERDSQVNPVNLPATCGRCHEDLDIVKKHEILFEKPIELYENSVHGKATMGGIYFAATCNDCHSAGGTAHRILGPSDPESPINHFNIPKTCGKCHRGVEQDYWEGIHGKLTARGGTDSPVCTECHGEHGIIAPDDPRSPVSPTRLAEATCSPCHESARLNEKYGIPTGRLRTYVDSYHGLKSRAGDVTVANCASCHGAHRILPHTDPASSIYRGNLQKTCGRCHPGISVAIANTPIHGTPGVSQTNAARIVQRIYIWAIVIIIGTMILHWLLDLRKQIKKVLQKKQIARMTLGEVWQHTFLMVTFTVLVITGFALRFSESWWVRLFFGWEGGFPLRGVIHRVTAVLFILASLWHLFYLSTVRGRRFLVDIFPAKKDIHHFWEMVRYNLDKQSVPPRFGRFSYVEKAEYWALVWGTAIMIFTGFFLWFDNVAVKWFPKGFLDVMLVMHYYEAWLATLAILIWHMYSTIFSPNVYPMNPSWLTGKMPIDWLKHEHPEDPTVSQAALAENDDAQEK